MLNIEKFKYEIGKCDREYEGNIEALKGFVKCMTRRDYVTSREAVDWLTKEYREPVLYGEEKSYLNAVIEPFRSRVVHICKQSCYISFYNIRIVLKPLENGLQEDIIDLPKFRKDSGRYKGMEPGKVYSLEELGL